MSNAVAFLFQSGPQKHAPRRSALVSAQTRLAVAKLRAQPLPCFHFSPTRDRTALLVAQNHETPLQYRLGAD
jgi:hypothetical protein